MSDDSTIDIKGEPDLHERWRQRLPESYCKHLDSLNSQYREVEAMQKRLRFIRGEFRKAADKESERAAKYITEALVLLACAEEKLMYALPAEVNMSRADIVELERERGKPLSWPIWP
jgi:hypothetical protein